jgi:hypothetical protein
MSRYSYNESPIAGNSLCTELNFTAERLYSQVEICLQSFLDKQVPGLIQRSLKRTYVQRSKQLQWSRGSFDTASWRHRCRSLPDYRARDPKDNGG